MVPLAPHLRPQVWRPILTCYRRWSLPLPPLLTHSLEPMVSSNLANTPSPSLPGVAGPPVPRQETQHEGEDDQHTVHTPCPTTLKASLHWMHRKNLWGYVFSFHFMEFWGQRSERIYLLISQLPQSHLASIPHTQLWGNAFPSPCSAGRQAFPPTAPVQSERSPSFARGP